MKPTPLTVKSLKSRGFKKPAATLAIIKQGLAESAAGKAGPRAKTVRTVFWQYDLYPYVLSGEIISSGCDERGVFYYLDGWDYTIFLRSKMLSVISGKAGQEIAAKLEALTAEHRAAKIELHNTFAARARAVLPFAVKVNGLTHQRLIP